MINIAFIFLLLAIIFLTLNVEYLSRRLKKQGEQFDRHIKEFHTPGESLLTPFLEALERYQPEHPVQHVELSQAIVDAISEEYED